MSDLAMAALEDDEFEEVYVDDEGEEVLGEDEEEEDPDYTPGDAEEDEDEEALSLDDEGEGGGGASLGDLSDTNAPYADAEEQQGAAARGGRGFSLAAPFRALGRLRPRQLASALRGQRKRLQRLVWRLEDASVFTAKFVLKAAVKGARPILVWLVVARALRTIDRSEDLGLRMMRQPPHKQIDYYYSNLLGKDWKEQIEQDFVDAVAEVDAGYVTDDMVRERRGLQAAIMRRLEVEEWDKQRMRHFYYGLYGLGPWYWDMEERLHNPFFIGARGWNGPPESWINENQVFLNDMPRRARDPRLDAAEELAALRGRPLSDAATRALMLAEEVRGVDKVLASPLFEGVPLSAAQVKRRLEQQREQEQQAQLQPA